MSYSSNGNAGSDPGVTEGVFDVDSAKSSSQSCLARYALPLEHLTGSGLLGGARRGRQGKSDRAHPDNRGRTDPISLHAGSSRRRGTRRQGRKNNLKRTVLIGLAALVL